MEKASRVNELGSAIFSEMDMLSKKVKSQGVDIINLSIGSPDRPPAEHIIKALQKGVGDQSIYGYALTEGLDNFKEAVADWYFERFQVELDPMKEVLSLMGSQDGLGHICLAFLNPGDLALVPEPGYPIYTASVVLAGGKKIAVPLKEKNNYLPELHLIPEEIAKKAKLLFLNYPNNPLAATADYDFFQEVVDFAKKYNVIVCHDNAYSELAFDGYRPISFLEIPGAKEVGVEFHSFSKTYNMAGCRIGFVVGNQDVIAALTAVKANIDYGIYKAIQLAGVAALTGPQDYVRENAQVYARRRDVLVDGLRKVGWEIPKPKATMFVWAPLPKGYTSSYDFAVKLLQKTGVVVVPGIGFGQLGEGYVRIALVEDEARLEQAVTRIRENFDFNSPLVKLA